MLRFIRILMYSNPLDNYTWCNQNTYLNDLHLPNQRRNIHSNSPKNFWNLVNCLNTSKYLITFTQILTRIHPITWRHLNTYSNKYFPKFASIHGQIFTQIHPNRYWNSVNNSNLSKYLLEFTRILAPIHPIDFVDLLETSNSKFLL